jgi:alkaline phosphatase|tara:strand:- start:234 stop:551 length:318 start_codon:yes stop_codon:yes gene_type:complete
MNKYLKITLVAVLVSISSFGQNAKGYSYKIHSHNDYMRDVPFWEAYANKASSIEVDIVLKNDTLFVAHEAESINSKKTLKAVKEDGYGEEGVGPILLPMTRAKEI